jgi:hypothetical protein
MDESRHHGDEVTKEDETVMDADQGNSTAASVETCIQRLTCTLYSALPYHIPTATRRRPEPSDAAHIHPRATVHAGAYNKVCLLC